MNLKNRFSKYCLIFLSSISIIICVFYIFYKSSGQQLFSNMPETSLSQANKTVLYISSYTASFERLPQQLEGISQVFNKYSVSFDHESYDWQHFNSKQGKTLFLEKLRYKLANHKSYDAILVSDDPALQIVLEYREELFKETPIIFFNITDLSLAEHAASEKNIAGKAMILPIEDNINIASKLNGDVKKVTYIYDCSPTSYGFFKQLVSNVHKFPQFVFEGIDATLFGPEQLKLILQKISPETILLVSDIFEDCNGNVYFPKQIASFISGATTVPVYTCFSSGIGNGYTGGKVVNNKQEAIFAANMIIAVLTGTPVDSFSLNLNTSYENLFDKNKVNYFKLPLSKISENVNLIRGSSLIREPNSGMELVTSILLISLTVLMITIHFEIIKDRNNEITLKDTKREILFRAEHDFLTKLPNRHNTRALLDSLIAEKKHIAVFLIDIDDFKNFNDFFTHACGDAILRTISNRFISLMIDDGIFASRFGGDEFLVIYKKGTLNEKSPIINKIRSVFDSPVFFEDRSFNVNASIGIANTTDETADTDEIISNADIAMYQAKKQGKNLCVFYKDSMKKVMQDSNNIIKMLEEACKTDGFEILYQPQINVETQEIYGYEALVRLKKSNLSPSIFIPIAEECGLISEIDRIVTKKVIQQLATWREHGMTLKRVSINYSYAQITDKDYPKYIDSLLKEYDIDPSFIGIEITEGLFIKNRNLAKSMFDEFAAIGVTLSLDDFGTGYSSLSYLTYLPVETVKIDKSLIDNYLSGNNDDFIENISHLIHSLNMKLTVEGVEFRWQFEKLKIFHCDYIQGYFFSKPITANEVEHWSNDMVEPTVKSE